MQQSRVLKSLGKVRNCSLNFKFGLVVITINPKRI